MSPDQSLSCALCLLSVIALRIFFLSSADSELLLPPLAMNTKGSCFLFSSQSPSIGKKPTIFQSNCLLRPWTIWRRPSSRSVNPVPFRIATGCAGRMYCQQNPRVFGNRPENGNHGQFPSKDLQGCVLEQSITSFFSK